MWTAQDRERYKDDGRRYPSDLADAEWALIWPLVETYPTLTKDLREMVNGCLYLAAEGCRWRSLPKEFGPWQTVRGYWDRVRRDGLWADAAALLTPAARARRGSVLSRRPGSWAPRVSCQVRRKASAGLMATGWSRASSGTS
jgi:putative transposase